MKQNSNVAKVSHDLNVAVKCIWLMLLTGAIAGPAQAQDVSAPIPPVANTEVLDFRGQWSHFLSTVVDGNAQGETRYGGRLDGHMQVDGETAGLLDGLKLNLGAEFIYGKSINRVGSRTFFPVNTAMNFPKNDDEAFDLSINVVQTIGKVRFQAGKINLLEASANIPIVAGGGKEGFQHIALAAPPGLVAQPKIFGVIMTAPAGPVVFNFGLWKPDDWTREYVPGGIVRDGLNGMIATVYPAKIGGQQGYHTFTLYLRDRKARGRTEFPSINLPDDVPQLLPDEEGGVHLRYAVQQYFWQDPLDKKRGFGFFGYVGASFGSPGVMDWSVNGGFAGSVPFKRRPEDRVGIGYFRTSLANRIVDGLKPVAPINDEEGGEIYYTAQIGKILRLSASAQWVNPLFTRQPNVAILNLRGVFDF